MQTLDKEKYCFMRREHFLRPYHEQQIWHQKKKIEAAEMQGRNDQWIAEIKSLIRQATSLEEIVKIESLIRSIHANSSASSSSKK